MADLHFLHARVHRARCRALIEPGLAGGASLSLVAFVSCPLCDACWFVPLQRALDPDHRKQAAYDAARQLSDDCPDHVHRFRRSLPALQR